MMLSFLLLIFCLFVLNAKIEGDVKIKVQFSKNEVTDFFHQNLRAVQL